MFPRIGIGFGPGTSEYGFAFAKISSLSSAAGATWDCWRFEKGQDAAVRVLTRFLGMNGRVYAEMECKRPMADQAAAQTELARRFTVGGIGSR